MKIRFINAVCILALILASACKSDNASQLKDKEMMITEKKNIGSKLALYPMPVTVVGAEVNGKVNWLLVAHVGIIGHDRILVSMSDKHYTNQGIIESKKLSVNLVDRKMLPKADYVGSVSGANTDKSHEFLFHWGRKRKSCNRRIAACDGMQRGGYIQVGRLRQFYLLDCQHLRCTRSA